MGTASGQERKKKKSFLVTYFPKLPWLLSLLPGLPPSHPLNIQAWSSSWHSATQCYTASPEALLGSWLCLSEWELGLRGQWLVGVIGWHRLGAW